MRLLNTTASPRSRGAFFNPNKKKKSASLLKYKQQAPIGIGKTRKQIDAVAEREETRVKRIVRAECVVRDGHCLVANWPHSRTDCDGPSEWAHLGDKKRAHTRGQAADVRHTTAGSCMLCRHHHRRYDDAADPFDIRPLTAAGADGAVMVVSNA